MADGVVVIGAGIVGLSAAIWLQRAGFAVTLIDREGPAAGTSFGNAGVLAAASVVPVPTPGLLAKVPRMLLDPGQPLFLRWSYLPRLAPFLWRYLRQGRADRVARISAGLTALLHDSPDQHLALARGTGAEDFIQPCSFIFGYPDRKAFEKDHLSWDTRMANGLPFVECDSAGLAARDPALGGRFGYGVDLPGHGLITDPGAYAHALAAHFEASGGQFLQAEVTGFRLEGGRARAALTTGGEVAGSHFVLTLGAWSGRLAQALGIRVRLESERGYHVEFHAPSITLRAPVMVTEGKFVASPMRGRLRAAGVVEFGGLAAGPSRAPFALLRRRMARIFPDLTYAHTTEWMGHRPATPDSLPVIGQVPAAANVFAGYGHQHVGLTAGPKTGRWIAQMIAGEAINTDLAPFAPDRDA